MPGALTAHSDGMQIIPFLYTMNLRAEHITKRYGDLDVLKGVDLVIHDAEIVSIVGSSGAGKSTLLHILGTLDAPSSGQVFLNDTLLGALKGKRLADFRNRHIGFVFQFHHLLPEFSALENVCIPAFIAQDRSSRDIKQRAMELLKILGLQDRKDHKPSKLSGGEQQRVAVARALINQPDVVMADEPTGNLDSRHARELHDLFFSLRKELGQTFVIVTHNEQLAAMSDRILHMQDGRILQDS